MQGLPIHPVRVFLLAAVLISPCVHADEPILVPPPSQVSFVDRATATAQGAIDQAKDLLGIRYRHEPVCPCAA
ncbi:MAG: hypothetical protein U1A72_02935 [Sulfuritalea sp.]|nr:hypothetical protein [Sulfuritalea sp.]